MFPKLKAEVGPDFREINGVSGITVNCGDIECVFEFIAYQYTGETTKEEGPQRVMLRDLPEQTGSEAPYDNDQGSGSQPAHVARSQTVPVPMSQQVNDP